MDAPNRICRDDPVHGETAYVYGLKARARWHHCLGHGTFSVDLGPVEELRRAYSRRVRPITYLPLYVKAVALTLQRNPEANAILFRRLFGLRIVRFERVDVNFPITRQYEGRWITFIGTVRDAPAKTLAQIQEELLVQQRGTPEACHALRRFLKLARLPLGLAKLFHWRMTRSPAFYVRNVGTCGLTLAEGGDWYEHLFPIAPTSVVFGLGAVRREPVVRGDAVVIARMLKVALMADNYVISGLVGARLARDFKEILESGTWIKEEIARTTAGVAAS